MYGMAMALDKGGTRQDTTRNLELATYLATLATVGK